MKIEKAYNLWAEQYDTNENKTRDLDKKVTVEILKKYQFSTVIELGCGTGKNTETLLKKTDNITGLDFSEEMLKIARKKFENNKVKFRQCDLTKKWNVENESADLITCSLTLEHIQDLNYIFKQANKKLQTDGYFFICELHPFKQYAGSKAKFTSENNEHQLETFTHHVSEYIDEAQKNGFKLLELNEWFDNAADDKLPRLISFVFTKYKPKHEKNYKQ